MRPSVQNTVLFRESGFPVTDGLKTVATHGVIHPTFPPTSHSLPGPELQDPASFPFSYAGAGTPLYTSRVAFSSLRPSTNTTIISERLNLTFSNS